MEQRDWIEGEALSETLYDIWCAGALTFLLAVCGLLLMVAGARAQSPGLAQVANAAAEDALRELAQQADAIFTGQVTAVRHRDGQGGATGIVEIDFAVEDAVRGTHGGLYTLREWAGLWTLGDAPFRAGQRYLMLLHAPGVSGLSSPVGGEDGAIPIRGSGAAVGPRTVDAAGPARLPTPTIDLRWVATRVVRPMEYARVPVRKPISGPFGPSPMHLTSPMSEVRSPVAAFAEPASQAAAYPAVLAMLRGWEKDRNGTR